jgi:hypothetical protein
LFYLCNYFVITFFNTAIVSCAVLRMAGGDPTVRDGFREAFARLPAILGWALVSATVGLVLRMIEARSEKIGRFVAGLLGMAWSLVSYLVVPIMVVERRGPFTALKTSTELLRKTWGEQLIGNFSFGAVFLLLALPAWLIIGFGFYLLFQGHPAATWMCVSVAIAFLIALSLVQSALQSIFQAAVYLYTRDQSGPAGFPSELLAGAVGTR